MKKALSEEDKKLNVWIGKRLTQIRLSVEPFLSQNELARRLGVARMTIINVEQGTQTMTSRDLFNASIIMGVHVSQFFPAIDIDGNFITQNEFVDLVEQYPELYHFSDFYIKTMEEIKTDALEKINAVKNPAVRKTNIEDDPNRVKRKYVKKAKKGELETA